MGLSFSPSADRPNPNKSRVSLARVLQITSPRAGNRPKCLSTIAASSCSRSSGKHRCKTTCYAPVVRVSHKRLRSSYNNCFAFHFWFNHLGPIFYLLAKICFAFHVRFKNGSHIYILGLVLGLFRFVRGVCVCVCPKQDVHLSKDTVT